MVQKNVEKEKRKALRVHFDMNTGERYMKSPRDYDRKKSKRELKKAFRDYIG